MISFCILGRDNYLSWIWNSGPYGQYATNVDAVSSHDAVRKAVVFFLDPLRKGPKPKAGTVLRVCPMGGRKSARVMSGGYWYCSWEKLRRMAGNRNRFVRRCGS